MSNSPPYLSWNIITSWTQILKLIYLIEWVRTYWNKMFFSISSLTSNHVCIFIYDSWFPFSRLEAKGSCVLCSFWYQNNANCLSISHNGTILLKIVPVVWTRDYLDIFSKPTLKQTCKTSYTIIIAWYLSQISDIFWI